MNTIFVIGSSLEDKGGIATVMNNIQKSFLNKKFRFIHITTYKTTGMVQKLMIYIKGIIKILFNIRKCEVAHIHMSYKGSFYRKSIIVLLLKLFNKPIIIHVHGSCFKEFYNNLGKISKSYCNLVFKKADKIIVLSQYWKEFFSTFVEKNKIIVINNNVPIKGLEHNLNKKDNEKVNFLFLGRFGKRKGIYDLLDVVKELKKKYPEKFNLIIAGDGEIEKVNQIIEHENMSDVIKNEGWISGEKKQKILENTNVFILPSYNEGLPMAILEAMSYHIPCISTEVGGIPEVIQDGLNGYLIAPGDKEKLYKCMEGMIIDRDKIDIMGRNAFETVQSNFNEEKEISKLEELYTNLILKENKIKKINLRSIIIYLIMGIVLFQDTIQKIIGFNALTYVDEILIVVMCIIAMIHIGKYKKINKFSWPILIGMLIFSAIGIVSCYINSFFNFKNTILSNFLAIKFFLMILAIININIKDNIKKCFVDSILFWGKIVLIGAIFNLLFPKIYSVLEIGTMTYRFNMLAICSLFNHPGKYGWFMLYIAIYYFSKYKHTHEKSDLIKTIIYVVFSLLSLRTKVILSVACIIIYELLMKIKDKQINFKSILIVFLILMAFLFVFKDILINTYKLYFTTINGTSARMALNKNAIEISKEYFPLGVGFGKYASWYARIYYSEYYYKYGMNKIYGLEPTDPKFGTDVFWPAIIGETGVFGFIVYIYILWKIYVFLKETYKNNNDINLKILTTFSILAFIQTICESTGEPSFNSAPQNIFIAIIIGITLCRRLEK